MKNLPSGTLVWLSKITGLPKQHLCDYLGGRRKPRPGRAIFLEEKTLAHGDFFTRENWMFAPEKIKQALINKNAVETA